MLFRVKEISRDLSYQRKLFTRQNIPAWKGDQGSLPAYRPGPD